MKSLVLVVILFSAFVAGAEAELFNSYTNHAGNAISGWPVKLTQKEVTLADSKSVNASTNQPFNSSSLTTYPLSIFPESEQRRIAADFVILQGGGQVELLRIPVAVKRAVAGAEKAMARSRKRAEKGLCTKDESEAFCNKSAAALRRYLDKQVKEGVITPAERKVIGH